MALYYPSAIPSETPPSSSSSLCRRRKYDYDVYLSFRGNDTCKNFADLLYTAMKGAGINVFGDDKELRVGESISENLLEAIECSRISVIIFSKDYAASIRCLEELAKIMECRTTFQQPVMPIICTVEEIATKFDTFRCLFEAFATHEGRFDSDKMLRWREALTEAENFPAFEYRDGNGEETECIQKFLKDILRTLGAILLNERRDNMEIVDDGANGRRIGKLFVSDKEIARGNNGTTVFEGTYSGRVVAVKRLLKTHHDVAFKEVHNLIECDQHQNIVRLYGEESDRNFVCLALEQCTCSLADLIQIYSDNSQNTPFSDKYIKVRLDSVRHILGDIKLWKANGRPSPLLLELTRDVVSGLVRLHELGIIHRDLKPQNVLIIEKEKSLLAKLSDMGISKRLDPDMSSLGTSGWKAPEWLLRGPQTRALDLFSLGCVLFFCITRGRHPFGDHFERDYNIVKNQVDLSAVENIPEAVDLFSHLLHHDPELRPEALQVLQHPLFWDSNTRLSFVRDTSDQVTSKVKRSTRKKIKLNTESNSNDLLNALENIAPLTFDAQWETKMHSAFIDNIRLCGNYNFASVRDLLRVMRNKWTHYEEFPKEIKEILGSVPEGFDDYFASLFPKLLIEVYKVVAQYCKEEEWCEKYLKFNV